MKEFQTRIIIGASFDLLRFKKKRILMTDLYISIICKRSQIYTDTIIADYYSEMVSLIEILLVWPLSRQKPLKMHSICWPNDIESVSRTLRIHRKSVSTRDAAIREIDNDNHWIASPSCLASKVAIDFSYLSRFFVDILDNTIHRKYFYM